MGNGQVEVISITLMHLELRGTLHSVLLEAVDRFQYVAIGAQVLQMIYISCFTLTQGLMICVLVQPRADRAEEKEQEQEAPRIGGRGKPPEPSSLKLKRRLGRAARKLIMLSARHDVKGGAAPHLIGRMNAAHGTASYT